MSTFWISDPGATLAVRWMVAAVFLLAVVHKTRSVVAFSATLRSYQLLPDVLTGVVAYLLIAAEAVTAVALLLNINDGAVAAASLLLLYAIAMLINLLRGRRDIDCGCSGPALRQPLSFHLVVRNLLLAGLAMLTLAGGGSRELTALDFFTALMAMLSFALLYSSAGILSTLRTRFAR